MLKMLMLGMATCTHCNSFPWNFLTHFEAIALETTMATPPHMLAWASASEKKISQCSPMATWALLQRGVHLGLLHEHYAHLVLSRLLVEFVRLLHKAIYDDLPDLEAVLSFASWAASPTRTPRYPPSRLPCLGALLKSPLPLCVPSWSGSRWALRLNGVAVAWFNLHAVWRATFGVFGFDSCFLVLASLYVLLSSFLSSSDLLCQALSRVLLRAPRIRSRYLRASAARFSASPFFYAA